MASKLESDRFLLGMEKRIGEVAVSLNLDQTFDYFILPLFRGEAAVGKRVRVPFGNEVIKGFLIGFKEESEYKGRLHQILKVIDPEPIISEQSLKLARWISTYYFSPLGMVLKGITPVKGTAKGSAFKSTKHVRLKVELAEALEQIEILAKKAPQQAALLKALLILDSPPTERELLRMVGCSRGPLKSLEERRILMVEERRKTGPPRADFQEKTEEVSLNQEQRVAVSQITKAIDDSGGRFLLHGVNGSGKTEVYIKACRKALQLGRQAIVVVPEISLTPQLISRFRNRFGEGIAVFHSGLTDAERARQWARMKSGEAELAIGVRSAIFAPFSNLGLIVIDEEHEPTYKQEDLAPRYHLREVALERAKLEGATVVMGSATPTLESYYKALKGDQELLKLEERVVGERAPEIALVDMEREKGLFSQLLKERIAERLKNGEQIILLLNRRGFSSCIICKRCRKAIKCPHCQISLVYHFKEQQLRCHYCGYTLRRGKCRECGSSELRFLRTGTEQVELELRKLFPTAQIRRMDSDAVKRGEHGIILEGFRQGKLDILFGTQMIGVGLDFPNVTLVGIISADTTLDLPDFRAGERAFQLISQAAGRAGRGPKGGEVIIQTYHPEHYAIQRAAKQDYKGFYREEIKFREGLGYPPFSQLIRLVVEGYSEGKVARRAEKLKELLDKNRGTQVLGPSRTPLYRVRGKYHWQLFLKGQSATYDGKSMGEMVREALRETGREGIKVDVDPLSY